MAGKRSNYTKSNSYWSTSKRYERRQEEAIERQKAREKRTAIEQLELITNRPGESKREAMKLLAELA